MKIRPASFVVISLLVLSLAQAAFSQTIQFNRNFMCNGDTTRAFGDIVREMKRASWNLFPTLERTGTFRRERSKP